MVNAINTTHSNIYTSGVQYSSGVNNYSSILDGGSDSYYAEEIKDASIINDYIIDSQNEIFVIQVNTQNGVSLVNTAKSAVDDMQNVLGRMKEKINTLSESSSLEEIMDVQEDLDELLNELYDIKNGAKYNGELIFGEYNEKPARLHADDPDYDPRYMNSASFRIGYSTQQNSTMTINTAFSLGGFSVAINSANDIDSALGVTEALEKDLATFEKSLDSNKEVLTQNSQAATEQMKKLISFEAEPDMSDNMYVMKSFSEIRSSLVPSAVSQMYDFSSGRLAQIMTGVWGL